MQLINITIPAGFDGPQKSVPAPYTHMEVYLRRIPNKNRGTLLQITTYELGPKLAEIAENAPGDRAEHYLLEFLKSIASKRSAFQAAAPDRVELGGLPAARVEWTGDADGRHMSGVMYCVIVDTTAVTLHVQGFSDSPAQDVTNAIQAIEAVTFAD
jgi:hypothetical protein